MDVREKLVEFMSDLWCNSEYCEDCEFCNDIDGCSHRQKEIIADRLIDNGVTVQEWISVKEPPKEKGTYIVCTDNGGVLLGHWYGTAWNAGGGAKKHIAYWMEKPQPPKGE